jgi:membrane-bound lytic murein transglycosylase D
MEEGVLNKRYLFIFLLAFIVIGCTHSPTNPVAENSVNNDPILTDNSAQIADFISPPLDSALTKDLLAASSKNQLIWQHIESKLELTKLYDHPKVVLQKHKFLNNSEYLAKVTRRSEPFIHFVLSEIENRNMPAELVMLPIVESGYYPRARSRAKAEGLWQIMPYTAKDLGLERSVGYDGRHDVYASTSAALDYLEQMYSKFDGDWLLALAAYNAGPQRVKRALKKAKVHDENVYWNLRLPRETREYVPKILALCAIIKDENYSSTLLHPISNSPYLESIELSKRISPAKLIQAAAVSETEIKLLNPAIRNLNTPIHTGYHLLVPKRDAEFLALAIDNMEEAAQPSWAKHKINRGESLSGIARRYGTSIRALREANNMQNNKIVSGRTLVIPLKQTKALNTSTTSAKTPAIIEASYSQEKTDTPYVHVVALGDSLWKIANRNNTTVKRLFEINGLIPGQPLKPGQTILVD